MVNIRRLVNSLVPPTPTVLCTHQVAVSVQRHYHPRRINAAYRRFQRAYPAYASTRRLDALRTTEYTRLDQQGHVYLDYTGGSLYAESQLRDHMALLNSQVFGNPHSKNLTSMAMTNLVERTREYVLQYFNASPDEYIVIFTQNATGALKLVGEAYPFATGGTYLLTFDNHNSVTASASLPAPVARP